MTNIPYLNDCLFIHLLLVNEEGRKSLLKLAERMVSWFCGALSSSIVNTWTTLSGNDTDNVKVMTRKNVDDSTMPFGLHLTIATSFWLSSPPKRVFDYLRDFESRKEVINTIILHCTHFFALLSSFCI